MNLSLLRGKRIWPLHSHSRITQVTASFLSFNVQCSKNNRPIPLNEQPNTSAERKWEAHANQDRHKESPSITLP